MKYIADVTNLTIFNSGTHVQCLDKALVAPNAHVADILLINTFYH